MCHGPTDFKTHLLGFVSLENFQTVEASNQKEKLLIPVICIEVVKFEIFSWPNYDRLDFYTQQCWILSVSYEESDIHITILQEVLHIFRQLVSQIDLSEIKTLTYPYYMILRHFLFSNRWREKTKSLENTIFLPVVSSLFFSFVKDTQMN